MPRGRVDERSVGEAARNSDARAANLRTTLRAISSAGGISRAAIARLTGLTRATVSSLVAELMDEDLVEEIGQGVSRGGKPPTLLDVRADGRHLIALDLSSQPFRGVRVDLAGRVVATAVASDRRTTADEALEEVRRLVATLADVDGSPVAGVGIGTPGLVDSSGVVHEAPNLEWYDLPLADELADMGLRTFVANDADVAALAEYAALPDGVDDVVVVRIADGVGAGIVLGGHLWRGPRAAAGEIGHLVVDEDGAPCSCGNRGCLETIVSTPAILDAGIAHPDGIPGAASEAGRHLGRVLAHLVAVLDVADIVLACRTEDVGAPLVAAVTEQLENHLLPGTGRELRVRMSTLGPDLVLTGASTMVAQEALGLVGR